MSEQEIIHVDGTDYPTALTKKYRRRCGWERPDPKKLGAVIPGTILDVHVVAGDEVRRGQAVLVLEAMKMRNEVLAPRAGVVAVVHVAAGDIVVKRQLLVEFE